MNIVLNIALATERIFYYCTGTPLACRDTHDRAVWQYITVSHKQLVFDVVTKPLAML